MRTTADRIRHTLLFEVLGLALCIPLASWVLQRDLADVGLLGIVLSVMAMGLNYLFNLSFDKVLLRLGHPVHLRPVWMRVLHAFLFESSLVLLAIPLVAWWLKITVFAAFLTDLGFALFFLVFAFIYNWGYDLVFPIMPIQHEDLDDGEELSPGC